MRSIHTYIIEIISISDKLEMEDNPGLLVSIDFYKAFDTLAWSFLKKAFEYLHFPERLIKWLLVIYNNIDNEINNNGYMSERFMVIVMYMVDYSTKCFPKALFDLSYI